MRRGNAAETESVKFGLGKLSFFCCWDGRNPAVEFKQQDASLVQYRVQHNRLKEEQ